MSASSTGPGGVIADTLFVGLTRPALALGVPYAALLATAVVTVETFLLSRNLLALLVCLPIYGIARIATASDPRYFEVWADWAPRAARHWTANVAHWGGRSLGAVAAGATGWVRT